YVEKRADAGIIAIPNNTDVWPNYNRREALALIQKHVGPNYEILEEREVVVGQSTRNDQQVNTEQTVNRTIPFLPAHKQTISNTTTQHDITEWRIVYRRVPGPMTGLPGQPGAGGVPAGGVPTGSVPAGAVPAGGVPVGVTPSVQPATVTTSRSTGTTGTG